MLTHKEIKKLVHEYKGRAVDSGKVWIVPFHIEQSLLMLRSKTAEMSLEQLHTEEQDVGSRLAKAQDALTGLAVVIHDEEIARSRVRGMPPSWKKALDRYVMCYNGWKLLLAQSRELRRLIEGPIVEHRKGVSVTRERIGGTRSKREKGTPKATIDLSRGHYSNEFLQSEEGWLLRFAGGKHLVLKDRKGLMYLSVLLSHPGRLVHCDDLIGLNRKISSESWVDHSKSDDARSADQVSDMVGNESFSIKDRNSEIEEIDHKAAVEYRGRLQTIEDLLSSQSMSRMKRTRLETEAAMLRRSLAKTGKGRGIISANDKKKMNSVAKAIKDAISAIAKAEEKGRVAQSRSLADHLDGTIKMGMQLAYTPVHDVHWRIETSPR